MTRTSNNWTLLHAPQSSSDTSCSSSVDTYQRFSRPSKAWFNASMKASRHLLSPETVDRRCTVGTKLDGVAGLETRYAPVWMNVEARKNMKRT